MQTEIMNIARWRYPQVHFTEKIDIVSSDQSIDGSRANGRSVWMSTVLLCLSMTQFGTGHCAGAFPAACRSDARPMRSLMKTELAAEIFPRRSILSR